MKRGTTNPHLQKLIVDLKKSKKPIWKAIAGRLEKPSRLRASVNIRKINKYTKDGETVVVPGKVLSDGELEHKVTIAALSFSYSTLKKLKGKAECLNIHELLKKNPSGSGVRILV